VSFVVPRDPSRGAMLAILTADRVFLHRRWRDLLRPI
jgi:hypothetical protein